MTSLKNFLIVLVVLMVAGGWFGRLAWQSMYKEPHAQLVQRRIQLRQQIESGTQTLANMRQTVNVNQGYFYRSFPLDRAAGQAAYQMWLTQLGEFCDMDSLNVTPGEYKPAQGFATQQYQVHARCSMEDLYRFLYEFYWAPLLHRVDSLDINSVEKTDLLDITLIVQSLTLARPTPQSPYPLADRLPLGSSFLQRLASGPFKAYGDIARYELFRYSPPGIDAAHYVILTGTPVVSNPADGTSTVTSRWKYETEGRTVQLKVGDKIQVGSFDGLIDAIDGDLVVIRQDNGYRWVVMLGDKLSEATAVPPELF